LRCTNLYLEESRRGQRGAAWRVDLEGHIYRRFSGPTTMKVPTILSVVMLSGCTADGSTEVHPIPGSITNGGQPRTKLTRRVVGSDFP
jgi:hypothetical protein